MQLARMAFLGFLLMTTACASRTGAVRPPKPPRGGILDFRLDKYNARIIEGRLLVGATDDPLRIDSRQEAWFSLDYDNMHACGKTKPFGYFHIDRVSTPVPADRLITLRYGTWYGETVRFAIIFHIKDYVDGPDCLEATLRAWSSDERLIAELPIRVERTDIRTAPKDKNEGSKEPKESTPDAPSPKGP